MVEYFKSVGCESNSTLGQCVIIALIVNDFFGDNIMMCTSLFCTFYYNIVLDLMDVLFFGEIIQYEYGEEVTRKILL